MKTDLMAFPIQIKNVGLSPARIDSVAFRYRLLDNLADLAGDPEYPDAVPFNGWVLAPQDSIGYVAPLAQGDSIPAAELNQHVLDKTKVLFAYGSIKYRDIFNRNRETRISYAYEYFWLSAALRPSRRIKQAGPAKYNEST